MITDTIDPGLIWTLFILYGPGDIITTYIMVKQEGLQVEWNGFVRLILERWGIWGFVSLKILLALIIIDIPVPPTFTFGDGHFIKVGPMVFLGLIFAYGIIVYGNTQSIIEFREKKPLDQILRDFVSGRFRALRSSAVRRDFDSDRIN